MRINSINVIKPNNIYKPISFKSSSSSEAALSIQNPDVAQFERNFKGTVKADAVQSNPVKAIAYKVLRAFNLFTAPEAPEYRMADYIYPY